MFNAALFVVEMTFCALVRKPFHDLRGTHPMEHYQIVEVNQEYPSCITLKQEKIDC